MISLPVLVLNQNYEPLNVCNVRRAVILILKGRAEVLENGRGEIHAAFIAVPLPSVIRLLLLIRRPPPQRRLTRREVFIRDNYACQYCGKATRELTLDHVIPRHRGGEHIWENVVSACISCNHKKAGRTPSEAGMRLLKLPSRPPLYSYHIFYHHLQAREEWRRFIPYGARA